MALKIDDAWLWDFWIADDGTSYHLFYLHAPRSLLDPELRHRNATIGHAVSVDLTNWQVIGEVLAAGADGDFDATATWTGSVVRDDAGQWRMFYTGSVFYPTHNIETIGYAVSDNLYDWQKVPGPVVKADPRWYEVYGDSTWPEEAWRDPWVFKDPSGAGWHMLVTARANSGPVDDRGVIGHATSTDLESWTVHPPLSRPGAGFGHLEVPQLVTVEGRHLLLFSCASPALAGARKPSSGGVWALEVAELVGPYPVENASLVTSAPLYSARLAQTRTGAWVMLAFDTENADGVFPGSISDPFPAAIGLDGRLELLDVPNASDFAALVARDDSLSQAGSCAGILPSRSLP